MVETQLVGVVQRNIHGGNVFIGSDGYIKLNLLDSAEWTGNLERVASISESNLEFEELAFSLETLNMQLVPPPPPGFTNLMRETSHDDVDCKFFYDHTKRHISKR